MNISQGGVVTHF